MGLLSIACSTVSVVPSKVQTTGKNRLVEASSPTAAPIVEPSPTPTEIPVWECEVVATALNVREEPNEFSKILDTLLEGDKIQTLNPLTEWVEIKDKNVYVKGRYVQCHP